MGGTEGHFMSLEISHCIIKVPREWPEWNRNTLGAWTRSEKVHNAFHPTMKAEQSGETCSRLCRESV